MTSARGRLVVLEGAEGVGKSTQLRLLAEWLTAAGVRHRALREPGGTALGEEIRHLLLHRAGDMSPRAEALLYMASRAQLMEEVVVPAMQGGEIVVLDRFFLATYAYQAAGRGLPEREIRMANALATRGLVPDVTILLTAPEDERERRTRARGAPDRLERAGREFHAAVDRAFASFLTSEWQTLHPEAGPIVAVPGTGTQSAVFDRVRGVLVERWPETFTRSAQSSV
jgi:dTMP kinase